MVLDVKGYILDSGDDFLAKIHHCGQHHRKKYSRGREQMMGQETKVGKWTLFCSFIITFHEN